MAGYSRTEKVCWAQESIELTRKMLRVIDAVQFFKAAPSAETFGLANTQVQDLARWAQQLDEWQVYCASQAPKR